MKKPRTCGGLWDPTLAPDHPSGEDLSLGTPVSRQHGARSFCFLVKWTDRVYYQQVSVSSPLRFATFSAFIQFSRRHCPTQEATEKLQRPAKVEVPGSAGAKSPR